ncbi:hypothetical protein CRE_03853 [Caenorhabditis remanei]|uniref:5' exonuclease Apollo n=1 Tax=Caenorhabditis remanei TaxID=31234 RepID=E3LXH4_CAERE|nr:hypothetical protein CRE_03853 [Caenorhabditis remanei]
MVSYLKESFLQPCQMDEDKNYIRFKNYFDLIAQVHSVVETKRGFKYLRVWRTMQLGVSESEKSNENTMFYVTPEIFKSYIVKPDSRIGHAVEHYGKHYLLEIAVYGNHQNVLQTLNSGDFVVVKNIHATQKSVYGNLTTTLDLHEDGTRFNRGIYLVPNNCNDPQFRLYQKTCRRMLELFTDKENFKEFEIERRTSVNHPHVELMNRNLPRVNIEEKPSEVVEETVPAESSSADPEDTMCAKPYSKIEIGSSIAVDYFIKRSKRPYHFLTHAHTDHTRGLDLTAGRPVYCSPQTALILPKIMGVDPKHILDGTICPLELMRPHRFEGFQVTLLDANHCPGSVMFLFEGYLIEEFAGGPVLCTGDFRADKTFMNRLDGPLNFLSEFRLARIYLDNTYFKLDLEFPTRKSAQKKLIKEIKAKRDKNIFIPLHRLGRESLLEETSRILKEPIIIYKEKLEIAELLNHFKKKIETRKSNRKIEVVKKEHNILKLVLHSGEGVTIFSFRIPVSENSVIIDLSALHHLVGTRVATDEKREIIRISYSDHSSRTEILEFLKELSFESIYPASKEFTKNEMKTMLEAGKEFKLEDLDKHLSVPDFRKKRSNAIEDNVFCKSPDI